MRLMVLAQSLQPLQTPAPKIQDPNLYDSPHTLNIHVTALDFFTDH